MRSSGKFTVPAPDAPRAEYEQFIEERLAFIMRLAHTVARARRMSPTEAPDFASNVLVHLMEHDFSVLRQFGRRSSFRTYLTTVIRRLCLDARVAAWGKWRPSADSRRAGALVVLLEQLATRDGLTFDQACTVLRTNHRLEFDTRVLEAHHAGFKARMRPYFVPDTCVLVEPAGPVGADWRIEDRDAYRLLTHTNSRLGVAFDRLAPEDRTLLTLYFRDGLTVSAAARLLGGDQKQLHRRFSRALKQLRRALESDGLGREDLLNAVGRSFVAPLDLLSAVPSQASTLPN